ncbi:MAG: acyl carrier protein [Chitinivibrionales bacterium]|nr:acyl carrier protein [Chitinivibrionales bacterium]
MELSGPDAVILEKMDKVIREVLKPGAAPITLDKRFKEDLGADSLDSVALIMALEEEFKTSISEEQARSFTSVGGVYDFIKARLVAAKAS